MDTRIWVLVTTHSEPAVPAKACSSSFKGHGTLFMAHGDIHGHVQIFTHLFTILFKEEIKFILFMYAPEQSEAKAHFTF